MSGFFDAVGTATRIVLRDPYMYLPEFLGGISTALAIGFCIWFAKTQLWLNWHFWRGFGPKFRRLWAWAIYRIARRPRP